MSIQQNCDICCRQYSKLRTLLKCKHKFCLNCWKDLVVSQLQDANPIIQCPQCNQKQLDKSGQSAYQFFSVSLQQLIRRFYNGKPQNPCQFPDCDGNISYGLCTMCGQDCCPVCRKTVHQGNCKESSVIIDQKKFKKCTKCKILIERNGGCNKIRCKCKHTFCFIDGQDWSQKHHFCGQKGFYDLFKNFCFDCFGYSGLQKIQQE